jgi:hypothetical protein
LVALTVPVGALSTVAAGLRLAMLSAVGHIPQIETPALFDARQAAVLACIR